MTVIAIVIGAAIGAPLRFLVDRRFSGGRSAGFPLGILLVNTAGALLLALIVAAAWSGPIAEGLAVGLCGTVTTYSTFADQTRRLFADGEHRLAWLNILANLVLGTLAVILGFAVGSALA
ncbi:CrcB protein [Stackebrandtia endophytica]|uniref:Fluoride-specific ion channel FluC n=1 Tax=Stackebrandtia endophytica TaxID=1496996 RepID=A0A543AWG7_9ACTN|nr:CrcB family protein [Stackebrandtia endophytica]TQL76912.1 CrcB protein [Stackebrandtia endophytica]